MVINFEVVFVRNWCIDFMGDLCYNISWLQMAQILSIFLQYKEIKYDQLHFTSDFNFG